MALSELTTPKLVHSSFAQVLHADGPDTARATELALYSWIVGRWDMDVTTILEDGTTHRGRGEIHAGWVLQGLAIQDVWMIPRLRDRQPGIEPLPGAGNWYGTTLRIYDPEARRLANPVERSRDQFLHATDRPSARPRHRPDRSGSEGRFDALGLQ